MRIIPFLLTAVLIFQFSSFSLCQTNSKLSTLLGSDFVYSKPAESYPQNPTGENLTYHYSTTLLGDTTGVSNETEFLMFRQSGKPTSGEVGKFILSRFVSNKEWQEFENYVIDSIARFILAEKVSLSDYTKMNVDAAGKVLPLDQQKLNYEKAINVTDWAWRGILDNMFYPPWQQFGRAYEIDPQTLSYACQTEVNGKAGTAVISIFREYFLWAKNSNHLFDKRYRLAEMYHKLKMFTDFPVVGILGTQVQAYLNFKERKLQKKIDENKLNYRIELTLPTTDEVTEIKNQGIKGVLTSEKNMTDFWKITNQEYAHYLSFVKDSILRNHFGVEGQLEKTFMTPHYDGSDWTSPRERDSWNIKYGSSGAVPKELLFRYYPESAFENSRYLKTDKNGFVQYPKAFSFELSLLDDGFFSKEFMYEYYWMDFKGMCKTGDLVWVINDDPAQAGGSFECPNDQWYCKGASLDYYPQSSSVSSGVRTYEDRSEYIVQESVFGYPGILCAMCNRDCYREYGEQPYVNCVKHRNNCRDIEDIPLYDFSSSPEDLVQNITYEQALAFYNWKIRSRNLMQCDCDAILFSILPSEEEFKKVQAGEQVIAGEEKIPLPSPAFRYTIHVYTK